MKIFIFARPRDHMSPKDIGFLKKVADDSGVDYMINKEYADLVHYLIGERVPFYTELSEKDLDGDAVMMAVGGDGTFLGAVQRLKGLPMPIVGVNMGRLGFLAGISPHEFTKSLDDIRKSNYGIERRTMIEVEGDFGFVPEFPCALNEFTIHRHNASMVEVTIHADGQLIGISRGDGLILSTPTGSTAYSLSAGGPVVSPECSCFVMTAIAPHNFTMRPLVLPDTAKIEMKISSRGKDVAVSLDNQSFIVSDGARFTVKKSIFSTFLVHLQNISFYDTLRNKMMWGMDKRNPGV